jgi:hypothetical protein
VVWVSESEADLDLPAQSAQWKQNRKSFAMPAVARKTVAPQNGKPGRHVHGMG